MTQPHTLFSEFDISLLKSGKHFRLYDKLGSHLATFNGKEGVYFAVWAPNAKYVSVVGNFNQWDKASHPLSIRWDGSGIWEGFIPGITKGEVYKYHIKSHHKGLELAKGDPFARLWETPPATASVVWEDDYQWGDQQWQSNAKEKAGQPKPFSVYELHLGSWMRKEGNAQLSYLDLSDKLVNYVKEMGFTHVELMPVMEHPYPPSWGYQITGFFAPTSRFGKPDHFKALVDKFHQAGIGVILDWVPSHFPTDIHGLAMFDGTCLYEHEDPRQGYHPDWKSLIFNYGRGEVRAFLISNALYWLDQFHIDGLRVDAVASMLYLDYSREEGQWIPNQYGGKENLEAISFLKELNSTVYKEYPHVEVIAEESTAFPAVSRPTYVGGLGFGQKWMMGWMHDTLNYFKRDPIYRKFHQDQITFGLVYAYSENFMLPLSHDEVVHGKASLIGKMPGDEWQQFANLRLMFGYQWTHPGHQLLFMGGEFAQRREWNFDGSLDWNLLDYPLHKGMQKWVAALNKLYTTYPALYELAFSGEGFEWVDFSDRQNSVVSYLRKSTKAGDELLVVCNFTPKVHYGYNVGINSPDYYWQEILNSDHADFGGSGVSNSGRIPPQEIACHGRSNSIPLTLPPLAILILAPHKQPKNTKIITTSVKKTTTSVTKVKNVSSKSKVV